MSYTIVIACIAACWAFLSVVGSAEATRQEAEKALAATSKPTETPAA